MKLFVARDARGAWCALKFQQPADPARLGDLVQRDASIRSLSRQPGFLEILDHGTTPDGWAWKALPLADRLPSLPEVDTNGGLDAYTPLTLGAWSSVHGLPPAHLVLRWGIRLANALAVLHRAGFVHRDVKPANILFVDDEPCLGDYELTGRPAEEFDYRGTEGYRPVEGTNDAGADLYALGKSLYESWTGLCRLEFPSLPKSFLQAPDWRREGSHLNEVLCRACDSQPRRRFRSAEEFSEALARVTRPDAATSRRRWLVGTSAAACGWLGTVLVRRHLTRTPRVSWQRIREQGFNVEWWNGDLWGVDPTRGKMYSFAIGRASVDSIFQVLDLRNFTMAHHELPKGIISADSRFLFHPPTREFWVFEGGNGRVFSLHPETRQLRLLGGAPHDNLHYAALTYWNPVTHRVGIWGGYGDRRVCNDRAEFDAATKSWIRLPPGMNQAIPWAREPGRPLVPSPDGEKLFLVGGNGSPSRIQGRRTPGLRAFNGRFHDLDDVWELNLRTDQWRCLLPVGHLHPRELRAAIFEPALGGLVIFESGDLGGSNALPATSWLFRPGVDPEPVLLTAEGTVPQLAGVSSFYVDPLRKVVVLLATDGIFEATLHPG